MTQLILLILLHARPGWLPPDWLRHLAFIIDVALAGALLARVF